MFFLKLLCQSINDTHGIVYCGSALYIEVKKAMSLKANLAFLIAFSISNSFYLINFSTSSKSCSSSTMYPDSLRS